MATGVALDVLLQNTGLRATFTDDRNAVIVLSPAAVLPAYSEAPPLTVVPLGAIHVEAPAGVESHPNGGLRGLYASLVQAELARALHRNRRMAGSAEVSVRIWLDASGVVQRTELIGASGRDSLERMVMKAFEKLSIGQPPPPDLLQPVSIRIAVSEH